MQIRGAHDVRGNEHALQHGVGVVADEPAILERAGLALGRIADHLASGAVVVRDARPLRAGGEARAPTAPQVGVLHRAEDFLGGASSGEVDRLLSPGVAVGAVVPERGVGDQTMLGEAHGPTWWALGAVDRNDHRQRGGGGPLWPIVDTMAGAGGHGTTADAPVSMPPSPVVPGDVVGGRYRVLREIGRGGMGLVVAAEHLQLAAAGRHQVLDQRGRYPRLRLRFSQEAGDGRTAAKRARLPRARRRRARRGRALHGDGASRRERISSRSCGSVGRYRCTRWSTTRCRPARRSRRLIGWGSFIAI